MRLRGVDIGGIDNATASALLKEHDALLRFLVNKHKLPRGMPCVNTKDDQMQIARVALLQAHVLFDGERSSFRTWAYRYVSQVLGALRADAHGKSRRVVGGKTVWADSDRKPPGGSCLSLDFQPPWKELRRDPRLLPCDDAPRRLEEVISAAETHDEAVDNRHAVEYFLGLLTSEERRVVELWMDGRTFEEIGREVGCTRQRAHQIHDAAISKAQSTMKRKQ